MVLGCRVLDVCILLSGVTSYGLGGTDGPGHSRRGEVKVGIDVQDHGL